LPCKVSARAIHLLSGISGWGYPNTAQKEITMIVRLHYASGATEDHSFTNGVHFADYVRRVDVAGSKFAFEAEGGKQVRLLSLIPGNSSEIHRIEILKGNCRSAPVILAVTVEQIGRKQTSAGVTLSEVKTLSAYSALTSLGRP
jgi:hypothetical protein